MCYELSIGIHTFSIFSKTTWNIADELLNIFKNTEGMKVYKSKENPNNYVAEFIGKYKGVSWLIRFDNKSTEYKFYAIEAKINPKILIGETDYITACNESYFDRIVTAYDAMVVKISPLLPLFGYCALNRIDYCINFKHPDVKKIIKLIKRGKIPSHYTERKEYNSFSHRWESCCYSFYLKSSSDSVTVNCYDKQAQLEELQRKYKRHDFSERIKAAEGILRFEIQCDRIKIYSLVQGIRQEFGNQELLGNIEISRHLLSDKTSKKVLLYYFSEVIGFGDYYTLPKAKALIENLCRSPKTERLIASLELINKCRGVHKAYHQLESEREKALESEDMDAAAIAGMKMTGLCTALSDLNKLRINPVTIPREWGIDCMPNLLKGYVM